MSKTLKITALAAALLCVAGANAQSEVKVSGLIDMYAGSMKMAGDATRQNVINSGGLTTSWFGFSGSEDLGGGLKANFLLTAFVRADTGVSGRFANDPLFSRDANIGLSGDFGAVTLGRGFAPNFLPSVIGNPFGGSFTFSPLILHMNVPLFNGSGWGATTPSDTGWSNEIIYTTPKFGGLSGNIHYQFGEQAGDSSKKNIGANFIYFGGPLTMTGFYEIDQINNPATPNAPLPNKKTDWMLLGSYDFGMVKPFLSYGQAKENSTVNKVSNSSKTYQIGASIPTSATGKILTSWVKTDVAPISITRKTFTLGYDHNLSKRTDVYAMIMNDAITKQTSGNSVAVGIRHSF